MSNKLAANALNRATKLIVFQMLVVVICAVLFTFCDDLHAGYSALLGGTIYVLPNYVFTRLAFRYMGARQIRNVASSFAKGELFKLLLTIASFIVVFSLWKVDFISLYVTFSLAVVSQLFAPYFMNKKLG